MQHPIHTCITSIAALNGNEIVLISKSTGLGTILVVISHRPFRSPIFVTMICSHLLQIHQQFEHFSNQRKKSPEIYCMMKFFMKMQHKPTKQLLTVSSFALPFFRFIACGVYACLLYDAISTLFRRLKI